MSLSRHPEPDRPGLFEPALPGASLQPMTGFAQGLPMLFNALRLLRQSGVLIVSLGLIGALIALGITYLIAPTYESSALVLLNDDQAPAVPFENGITSLPTIERRDNTQLQIARKRL